MIQTDTNSESPNGRITLTTAEQDKQKFDANLLLQDNILDGCCEGQDVCSSVCASVRASMRVFVHVCACVCVCVRVCVCVYDVIGPCTVRHFGSEKKIWDNFLRGLTDLYSPVLTLIVDVISIPSRKLHWLNKYPKSC